jgi:acyl-CoA thioester hydrolase
MKPFYWQARVYWEDTDGGGIVYYANYLKYLERARTEWLRAAGVNQRQIQLELGLVFAVVSLQADYRSAARLDDLLCISCVAAGDGGASMNVEQKIWRETDNGQLLFKAQLRIACLAADSLKPRRIPAVVLEALQ